MQVKKYEAPTIQEALDTIKRELGPDAIILQTKKNKKGFGLMSKSSVEVTVAVSDKSILKKKYFEQNLPQETKEAVRKMPVATQVMVYDKYVSPKFATPPVSRDSAPLLQQLAPQKDKVELNYVKKESRLSKLIPGAFGGTKDQSEGLKRRHAVTAQRYVDIDSDERIARPVMPVLADVEAVARKPVPNQLGIHEEVKQLKRMIEEMNTDKRDGGSGAQSLLRSPKLDSAAIQDALENLIINGVDKRFAVPLARKVAFELGEMKAKYPESVLDQLAGELVASIEVNSIIGALQPKGPNEDRSPVCMVIVGPTGVGKTTTVAKIASESITKRKLKVGLINLDFYKVAAFDQLATYAKILNSPFRNATNKADLGNAIKDFAQMDLILVDTTGRSQRDPEALNELQDILSDVENMRCELVLSATTRDQELYEQASRFRMFKPESLIISKLDEATTYGAIYNVSQKAKLPLSIFTTGQRVPEDIEEASSERVAALILDL